MGRKAGKSEKRVQGLNLDKELLQFLEERHLRYQAEKHVRMSFSQYINNILLAYKTRVEARAKKEEGNASGTVQL